METSAEVQTPWRRKNCMHARPSTDTPGVLEALLSAGMELAASMPRLAITLSIRAELKNSGNWRSG